MIVRAARQGSRSYGVNMEPEEIKRMLHYQGLCDDRAPRCCPEKTALESSVKISFSLSFSTCGMVWYGFKEIVRHKTVYGRYCMVSWKARGNPNDTQAVPA